MGHDFDSDDRVTGESAPAKLSLEQRLRAIEAVANLLEWPMPRIRDERLRWEFCRIIDGLLTNVARGRGALEIAIGEGLEALAVGDRVFDVGGYCNIGDCARERYGLPASTAVKLMRFARELRKRPILRAAVRAGTVSVSKAEAVLPVAIGDAERLWVARASTWTVRRLDEAVKTGRTPDADDAQGDDGDPTAETADVRPAHVCDGARPDDERWTRLIVDVPPEGLPVIEEGIALVRKAIERPAAPKWEALEWAAAEFRSSLGVSADLDAAAATIGTPTDTEDSLGSIDILGESLDEQVAYWTNLVRVPAVEAPGENAAALRDPKRIDEQLRRHVSALRNWDRLFGHLAFLFKKMRCWHVAGFASFAQYSLERLGMAARTVEQRIALEERLHELPALGAAMTDGRVSYEQARVIARHADRVTVQARIEQAQRMTCIELRRRLEADEDAQMSARRKFKAVVPCRVADELQAVFRVLRQRAGKPLSAGECLVLLFAHFIEVWKPLLARRSTLQRRVLERDEYRCQVPGCSRTAAHAHHIIPRSAGGPDEMWNLISVCAAHHLHGIHGGKVRVTGKAPDQLRWTMNGTLPEIEGRWLAARAAA